MNSRATGRNRGFTLIELMVVISIILILLGMAMPIYTHSMTRAKEENLRKNLDTLNRVIYQYTLDKKKPPKSLEDLKSAHYLVSIPEDINGADWALEQGDGAIMSLEQTDADGIIGVHSGSDKISSDGTAYSTW